MTGPATPSAPTLLGKLRALHKSMTATIDDFDGSKSQLIASQESALEEYENLLTAVIAELERMGKDARRLDSGTIRLSMLDEWGDISATLFTQVNLRAAIDAAMGEK